MKKGVLNTLFEDYIDFLIFFDGNEEFLKPTNPRDEFVNNSAIWHGVLNNNKLLVSAHNSFACKNENTRVTIVYSDVNYEVELLGNEIKLVVFNIS